MAGDRRRLIELGVAPPLANELATQITTGVGNFRRLRELGMPARASRLIASAVAAPPISVKALTEAGVVPVEAKEISTQIGTSIVPTKPQVVTTLNGLPNGVAASPAGLNIAMGTRTQSTGRNGATAIQIGVSTFLMQSSPAVPDSGFGNAVTFEFARQDAIGQPTTRLLWGGANSLNVADNTTLALSDAAGTLAANSPITWRSAATVAADGLNVANYGRATPDGFGKFSNSSAQLLTTGTMTGGSGTAIYLPSVTLGIPTGLQAAFCIYGDSIGNNQADTNTATTNGFFRRFMIGGVNGFSVPGTNFSVPGNNLQNFDPLNNPKALTFTQYHTDVILQVGTYEISQGYTLAQMQALLLRVINYIRGVSGPYGRPRIHGMEWAPRMANWVSTGSGVNEAGQTPATGFESGGVKDQTSAWMASQVGVLIDSWTDIWTDVRGADRSKFITNGTTNYASTDGIHPLDPWHALACTRAQTAWAPFEANPRLYIAPA